jgi:hypothetical protein
VDDHNDRLRELLKDWNAPEAPPSLEQRVLSLPTRATQTWWRFLLSGSIRVPVPLACGLALLMILIGFQWTRRAAPVGPCVASQTVTPQEPAQFFKRCHFSESCS